MQWIQLTDENQLNNIITRSREKSQVIFKHSTRCGISSVAFKRLEKMETQQNVDFYFLDLVAHRNISNKIAEIFNIHHESPQVLVIKGGECVYDESHLGIMAQDILKQAALN